jgi:hypothetical protein
MHKRLPPFNELELLRPAEAQILFPGCTANLPGHGNSVIKRLDKLAENDIVLGIDLQSNLWLIRTSASIATVLFRDAWLWKECRWERFK